MTNVGDGSRRPSRSGRDGHPLPTGPLGRSLDEPLAALDRWVDGYWPAIEEARRRWNRRSD
jgi:hypothetical protein